MRLEQNSLNTNCRLDWFKCCVAFFSLDSFTLLISIGERHREQTYLWSVSYWIFFLLNTVWEEWKARENCVMRCKVNLLWDWSNWNKINQLSLRCELTLWLRVDENHPWKPVSDIHIDTDISLLNGFSAVYIDMLNLCCLFVQMLNLVCQKAHSFRKLINKWGCSSIHYNLLFLCISQYLIGGKQL